jgi:hypothetical protein
LGPHEWKYSKSSENFAEYNWIMNDKILEQDNLTHVSSVCRMFLPLHHRYRHRADLNSHRPPPPPAFTRLFY